MHKTALIATTQPEVSRALTEWLAINDIDIQIASSGNDAIEHIVLDRPDVVLAQLAMEGMSGLRLEVMRQTQKDIQAMDAPCLLIPGDVGSPDFCRSAVRAVMDAYGRLDVLVNNAAQQYPAQSIEQISAEQLEHTFRTNIFSMFYLVKEAMPFLTRGARIINTTSVTAYRGSKHLVDYAATKGAIVAFTRSLSQQLAPAGIHVNAVAPGPIWTPLIPASFSEEEVASFGKNVPLGRPGQPDEVAPAYVFLATEGASYMTGQVLHPNGGEIVNT